MSLSIINCLADPHQGQRDSVCQRHHVLQGEEPDPRGGERGRLWGVRQALGRHHSQERARNPQPGRHSLTEGDHCKGDAGGKESRRINQPEKFAVHFCSCRLFSQDTLVEGTAAWGVQVERVEVMDDSIPEHLLSISS